MRLAHQSVLVLALVAITASVNAINKKSDESGMQPGNQPVYQAPGGPYSVPNHQYQQSQEHNAQANMQPGSQSNLYYYYYPVADKSKEGPYAHNANSPVNHASSAQHDGADHGSMDAAASGSEISYTSPEMNQMNQDYNQGSQGFDPSALNLAQQLNSNSGLYNFNGGPNNYDANAPNMGYGPQGDASSHMPTQVHPNYNGPMGPQGQMFSPGPYGGQHPFPNFGGQQAVQPQQNEVSGITAGLKKYGLSTILMPVLALAGLSLLLPTVTSLGTTTTKTKRSIDDSPISAYIEKMDNYYKLYNKAMEKEECMNRMICELGDAVSGVRGRSALLMVVENLAPQWMEKKMTVFKSGALSKDMSKCKKYSC